MSLGTKTTALFAAMVLAALTGGGFLLVHFQEKSLKQTIFDGLNGDANVAARGISSFVEEAIRESRVMAAGSGDKAQMLAAVVAA